MTGQDGVVRTRAEKGRVRHLVTKFGQISVSRIAYRSPGSPNVHPADAALNLPEEKHSHGLWKLAAIEASPGSIGAACAAVARATGVSIGKRQLGKGIVMLPEAPRPPTAKAAATAESRLATRLSPRRKGVCQFKDSVALSVVAGCADMSRSVMIDVTGLAGIVFSGCLRWSSRMSRTRAR